MGIKLKTPGSRAAKSVTVPSSVSLADALFSKTQQRLFALLFGKPERTFFATELISLAKSGSGAVQRELQRLTDSGLVVTSRVGNQKHYQANAAAPLFNELRGIALKTFGLAEPVRAALAPLMKEIQLALVYGSVAKRTDTALSDVDLLIVSDALTLERVYEALAPAERAVARKINPTIYTVEEFRRRRKSADSFVSKVLASDHIVLWGSERGTAETR